MRRALLFLFGAMLALANSNLARASQDAPPSPGFEQRILAIDEEYTYWDKRTILEYEILSVLPKFETLALLGDDYVDECLTFLAETIHTKQQRTIAIFSMHKLSMGKWIYFANRVLDLYERRLATAQDVMDVLTPMPGLSDHISANFLNRDVRALVYRARNIPELTAGEKRGLTQVLFGIDYLLRIINPPEVFQ